MRIGHAPDTNRTRVVVLSADTEFENSVRTTFGASAAIELRMISGSLAEQGDSLDITDATVAVVDLDARRPDEMEALARLIARRHLAAGHRCHAGIRCECRAHAVADEDR
jgi:hypothetical protein